MSIFRRPQRRRNCDGAWRYDTHCPEGLGEGADASSPRAFGVTDGQPHRSEGSSDSLLPPNWSELAPLVDAVLDAPLERRDAILDDLSKGNPRRRAELAKLVLDCERDQPLLNRPAAERFAALFDEG